MNVRIKVKCWEAAGIVALFISSAPVTVMRLEEVTCYNTKTWEHLKQEMWILFQNYLLSAYTCCNKLKCQGVSLTTYLRLVLGLRLNGATYLLPHYAFVA